MKYLPRLFAGILIIILSWSYSSAQNINAQEVEQTIKDFQKKVNNLLWEKAMDQSIATYSSDSLSRKISKSEIRRKGEQSLKIRIDNESMEYQETTIQMFPDALNGWAFSFERSYDLNSQQISFKPEAMAITHDMVSGGIGLGFQPVFWVRYDVIHKLLNSEDQEIFKSLVDWRIQLGDFFNQEWGTDVQSLVWNAQSRAEGWKPQMGFQDSVIKALSQYLLELPSTALAASNIDLTNQLYRDQSLTQPIKNLEFDFSRTFTVEIVNPNSENIEFVDTTLTVLFDVYSEHELSYTKQGIWKLDYTLEVDDDSHAFFVRQDLLDKLISEVDRILMKRFLKPSV